MLASTKPAEQRAARVAVWLHPSYSLQLGEIHSLDHTIHTSHTIVALAPALSIPMLCVFDSHHIPTAPSPPLPCPPLLSPTYLKPVSPSHPILPTSTLAQLDGCSNRTGGQGGVTRYPSRRRPHNDSLLNPTTMINGVNGNYKPSAISLVHLNCNSDRRSPRDGGLACSPRRSQQSREQRGSPCGCIPLTACSWEKYTHSIIQYIHLIQ